MTSHGGGASNDAVFDVFLDPLTNVCLDVVDRCLDIYWIDHILLQAISGHRAMRSHDQVIFRATNQQFQGNCDKPPPYCWNQKLSNIDSPIETEPK